MIMVTDSASFERCNAIVVVVRISIVGELDLPISVTWLDSTGHPCLWA